LKNLSIFLNNKKIKKYYEHLLKCQYYY
jgi:hypothetical protein